MKAKNNLFYNIIISLFTSLSIVSPTFAEANTLNIKCPESSNTTTLSCTLMGYSDIPIISASATLELSGLTYSSFTPTTDAALEVAGPQLKITFPTDVQEEFSIGEIVFNITSTTPSTSITLKDVLFSVSSTDYSSAIGSSAAANVTPQNITSNTTTNTTTNTTKPNTTNTTPIIGETNTTKNTTSSPLDFIKSPIIIAAIAAVMVLIIVIIIISSKKKNKEKQNTGSSVLPARKPQTYTPRPIYTPTNTIPNTPAGPTLPEIPIPPRPTPTPTQNYQNLPMPPISNPKDKGISVKDLPFEKASSDNPAVFEN